MMMERFMKLFRRSRDLHDIRAMSDRDLADLGVTRAQAEALTALPDDVPGRVAAMGRVFGLSEDTLTRQRDLWNEMLHSCHHCQDLATCERTMVNRITGEIPEVGFCPNAGAFAALSDRYASA
ncbi:MAG: DUF1127 domain-containing protein [Rhodobacter sp.]|nr:DUF1127 domain-containing protein [Paracoccaceae bacterium]MCB1346568.1 DUF1127 domain-containing protein [Paracoccaceae bacterium]MCC0072001.1 DUF1127 domain-containing protein [Rhodobacter sp.]